MDLLLYRLLAAPVWMATPFVQQQQQTQAVCDFEGPFFSFDPNLIYMQDVAKLYSASIIIDFVVLWL
jgi:hypothetical protein